MSKNQSPSHWNSNSEDRLLAEAGYAEDIGQRMRVPKRIKANGDVGDEDLHGPNGLSNWSYSREKFEMNVPDRIMLLGQDQHIDCDEEGDTPRAMYWRNLTESFYTDACEKLIMNIPEKITLLDVELPGTRAPPREIQLENSVMGHNMASPASGDMRVNTPPRVLTLEQHAFPSAAEPPTSPRPASPDNRLVYRNPVKINKVLDNSLNDSRVQLYREPTPPVEGLSAAEEVVHLRRQVARINRRVMAIEVDALQRQQRERLAAALGLAYLLFKVVAWLNRS